MHPSSRSKESTPPPSLLLMTPSSGLTFNMASSAMPSGPSLMPVSLSPSDDVGENDSFLGQTENVVLGGDLHAFNPAHPPQGSTAVSSGRFFEPSHQIETAPAMMSTNLSFGPPLPPMPSIGPSMSASNTSNRRYVLPPQTSVSSGPPQYQPQVAQVPPQYQPQVAQVPPHYQPPVAQVPPMMAASGGTSNSPPAPYLDNSDAASSLSFPQPTFGGQTMGQPMPTAEYQPAGAYWFYCCVMNGQKVWRPFSRHDAGRLDMAWEALGCPASPLEEEANGHDAELDDCGEEPVATDGGRYDVWVGRRKRRAVFWEEEIVGVRRSSWFYRPENEHRYLPYSESLCARMETHYRSILQTGAWHSQFEVTSASGTVETFVFHSPQSMVQYRGWGTPDTKFPAPLDADNQQMRPRVVRRGLDEFIDQLEDGEWQPVDHVIFVVHGIGSTCDLRWRPLVECVNDFRQVANQLMRSHFPHHVGRVEFLPVHWHKALHSEATGIDSHLKKITLRSIPKLRQYTNDTLIDILFYTSPKYCQTILDAVASEMCRLKNLFMTRRPEYAGEFSVAGHSLGSVICFDLLAHQGAPSQMRHEVAVAEAPAGDIAPSNGRKLSVTTEPDEINTVEQLLEKLSLQALLPTFEKEELDFESLLMLSDEDLKELGVHLGPRKKLSGFIKEHRAMLEKMEKASAELTLAEESRESTPVRGEATLRPETAILDPLLRRTTSQFVDYVLGSSGTGQPFVHYPQLDFPVANLFALGSPIALFLTTRGLERLGDDYRLPNIRGFFNIFHPFDPVAYRIETMINANLEARPVLIPHHKGRKRMHLELKENLSRMGSDLKTKIVSSLRYTWQTLNDFARAHRTTDKESTEGDNEMDEQEVARVLSQMGQSGERDDISSTVTEDDITIGQLNQGRRIDFVLQEAPLESFNDYLFALGSHACYWSSEDTLLLLLREIYVPLGVQVVMPGAAAQHVTPYVPPPPPPAQKQQMKGAYTSYQTQAPPPMPAQYARPPSGSLPNYQQHQGPPQPPTYTPYQGQMWTPAQSNQPPAHQDPLASVPAPWDTNIQSSPQRSTPSPVPSNASSGSQRQQSAANKLPPTTASMFGGAPLVTQHGKLLGKGRKH